ncbi:YEATS family protein [Cryptosporidium andersoni]|uniref:YEATS family protein n=1 Tax=Cryptosporidium andersoni TaxID=117008 RepID=A0A1J4MPJ3_9CRYT|nr:YEATS family protein [Cryptosporidium andersoni]
MDATIRPSRTTPTSGSSILTTIDNRRKKSVTITKPIVLGTYAFMLSIAEQKKRGDNATHSWTCFLRSPQNEDISYYVKKVVFSLHPSFINPNRTVEKSPFEVTEYGWGEFDIVAKIYFVDPIEKPVEIKHFLRLYPPGTTDVRNIKFPSDPNSCDCVTSETYDEFIFHEPTERFYEKLLAGPLQPFPEHRLQPYFHKPDKSAFEKALSSAHAAIQNELATLRAEIVQTVLDLQTTRENYYNLRPHEAINQFPQAFEQSKQNISSPVDKMKYGNNIQKNREHISGHQSINLYDQSPKSQYMENISQLIQQSHQQIDQLQNRQHTSIVDSSMNLQAQNIPQNLNQGHHLTQSQSLNQSKQQINNYQQYGVSSQIPISDITKSEIGSQHDMHISNTQTQSVAPPIQYSNTSIQPKLETSTYPSQ